nr:probable purine permease 4 [Ipomoea trifida]
MEADFYTGNLHNGSFNLPLRSSVAFMYCGSSASCFMGTAGMVFLTTSLTGGICMTALMAINVLAGVFAYRDLFGGSKEI